MTRSGFIKLVTGGHPGDLLQQRGNLRLLLMYLYNSVTDISTDFNSFQRFSKHVLGGHEGDFPQRKEGLSRLLMYLWDTVFEDMEDDEEFPYTLEELKDLITEGYEGDLANRKTKLITLAEVTWDYIIGAAVGNPFGTIEDYLAKDLIVEGDVNPEFTIVLKDGEGSLSADDADVETAANWTVTLASGSNLELDSISRDGNEVTFAFTGTAVAGKAVTVKPKAAVTVDSVLLGDFSFVIPAQATLAAKTGSTIVGGTETPSIILVLTNDTFKSTGVTTTTNWTVGVAGTGLTLGTIVQNGNEVTINFTGTTAASGNITFLAKKAILTNDRDSKTLTYAIVAAG